MPPRGEKALAWVGGSKRAFLKFPALVRQRMGFALYLAQCGEKHDSAKPLRGFGGTGVLELVEDHDGDTYRAVYAVRFVGRVYVLHAFQKKSKKGIATPRRDLDLIRQRLRIAEVDDRNHRAG